MVHSVFMRSSWVRRTDAVLHVPNDVTGNCRPPHYSSKSTDKSRSLRSLRKFSAKTDKECAHFVSKPQMDRTLEGSVGGPKHRTNIRTFVLCPFSQTMKSDLPKIHRTWGPTSTYFYSPLRKSPWDVSDLFATLWGDILMDIPQESCGFP